MVDEAVELVARGKKANAHARLKEAIKLDGANARGHYELAKLEAGHRQNMKAATQHYDCVFAIAPDTDMGKQASRAIGRASR